MFQKISPVLAAINIQITSAFYRDKLNFETSYVGNYLVVSKENIQLFFFEHDTKNHFQPSACFIFVSNIEDMYASFSSMGILEPKGKLQIKPGNLKEFAITDNNGHQLFFGEKQCSG